MSIGKGSINRVNNLKTSVGSNQLIKSEPLSHNNLLDIEKLLSVPDEWKFYKSSPLQLKSLKDSILKFGVLEPVIVRILLSGDFQLLSGYLRVQACSEVGIKQVKCELLYDISDEITKDIFMELHRDKTHDSNFSKTKFEAISRIKTELPDYLL